MNSIHRTRRLSITLAALVLGGAAVAAATQASAQALSAQPGARAGNAAASGQGNPDAQPPILPPVPHSERAQIRRGEAQMQQAFSYHLPASARYSTTEMDVFAAEGYGRSSPHHHAAQATVQQTETA
jgi:hypothetical protein